MQDGYKLWIQGFESTNYMKEITAFFKKLDDDSVFAAAYFAMLY